jgi:biliverdin reductase
MHERLRWAVIGVGTAGRARAGAIRADPRAALVAVHHGRHAAEIGAPIAETLHEAIEAADAVAIASPTALHPEQARAVLERARHVLVEFPLAPDTATALALFDRARAAGRVLHVEHIELLDPPCAALRAAVRPERVEAATVTFHGPGSGSAAAAELALGNVARLHRLVAACGPVAAVRAVEHVPGLLRADLTLTSGAPVRLRFERGPGLARQTSLEIVEGGRTWHQTNDRLSRDGAPVDLPGPIPLFATDQRYASARILDGAPHYVSEARIAHVLDIVGLLGDLRPGSLPHRSDAGAHP